MKYYTFFLLLIFISSTCKGNRYLDGVENNHNFYPPANTVERLLNSRQHDREINKYVIENSPVGIEIKNNFSRVKKIDLSMINQLRICSYANGRGSFINAEFIKNKNRWVLTRVFNKNSKNIDNAYIKGSSYNLNEADNCFSNFVKKWEAKYKKSRLRLVNQTSIINNVIVNIDNRNYEAIFNLIYKYPTENMMKSGWLINSFSLLQSANNEQLANKPIPKNNQAFPVSEVLSKSQMQASNVGKKKNEDTGVYTPNDGFPEINELSCYDDKVKRRIRLGFSLNKAVNIQSLLIFFDINNKFVNFSLNFNQSKSKVNFNNCHDLDRVFSYEIDLFTINLNAFKKNITGVRYGSGSNEKKSFIDYYY